MESSRGIGSASDLRPVRTIFRSGERMRAEAVGLLCESLRCTCIEHVVKVHTVVDRWLDEFLRWWVGKGKVVA